MLYEVASYRVLLQSLWDSLGEGDVLVLSVPKAYMIYHQEEALGNWHVAFIR